MEKEEKQSYQFRALSRKTLSYQKRQIFTNVCCVGCCPFLMVLICGILTIVVQTLVNNLSEVQYFRYCSDANASDPFTLLPSPLSESFVDEDGKEQTRFIVNFHPNGDCVQYFGGLFPTQYPYAPPQADNCSAFFNPELCPLDSTSPVPAPQNGWLPDPTSIPVTAGMAFANLILKQANFWGVVASKNGLDIGERPAKPSLSLTPPFVPSPSTPPSGFLANYKTEYFTPNNVEDYQAAKVVFEPRPYFKKVNTSEDYHEVDDSLLGIFDDLLSQLSELPILPKEPTDQERINYTLSAQAILRQVPMGALIIEELGPEKFEYILQMGTNRRLAFQASGDDVTGKSLPNSTYHFPPLLTEGYRRIYQHAKFVQAILSSIPAFANYTLTQGLRIFPEDLSTAFDLPIGSFTGEILYPFGVSFLLPVFVVSMVKEKEDRILIMMRMNGMKTRVYWLSEYIHFYVLHIIATAVFIITGVVLKLEFFTLTDPGAYVLMFFLWGHTQIAMAFFLSTLFNKSRVALILVFCLVLAGVVINVSFSFLFNPNSTPMAYLIYPPFAFYRAISIMNQKSFTPAFPAYSMEMMVPGDPVFDCAMAMIIETVLLFLISAYLMAVLPSEYGIHRPWHFVFSDPYKWWKKRQQKEKEKKPIKEEKITLNDSNEEDHFKEDEDVQAERVRLYNNEYDPDCPVIIKDMRKIYPNGKLAVKSISLAIEKNSVFGLLGPNGAGKTTLISILTGLYPPSSGQALLAGFDVNTEMEDIYLNIGVCPQHDILWDDLTVEEHLYFYARIKGVAPKNEAKAVDTAMETVSLKKYQNTLSKRLSGGEKRRLSIAISLIGDGKVIFLDEPTTGLDPEVRRLIWDIVNKAKVGRTIILTTHSMEEAEVLCQRIGIMAKGTLRCLGPQVRLKNKYGSGFKISISCNPEDHERVTNYIESLLPNGWKKLDDFVGSISYEFDAQEISSLFREIEERKEEVGIKFWGISQTSLEEVFIHIINEADAEAS